MENWAKMEDGFLMQRMNSIVKTTKNAKWILPWLGLTCLATLALSLTGCRTVQPKANIKFLQLGTNKVVNSVTIGVLQASIMRLADEYAGTVAQATDELAAKVGTPEARLTMLKWKLGQATSAYIDASGENPALNALDMLVMVTLARTVVEDYAVGQLFGDAALPLLETHRRLETNTWVIASGLLKPEQQQELRDLIREWRQKNPNQRYVGQIRFREFVAALGRTPQRTTTSAGSLFSLLFLDPFAGMDPTAAAIEETRALGERAMYYTQRMPTLLNWQMELLAYQIAVQPESKQLLSDTRRMSESADAFAKTAEKLPAVINDQRQAAIQQLLDGLKSEELKTRELLTEARQTLKAGNEMALSVNASIKSLDEFVRYFSPTNPPVTAASTNSKPFNVLDYGTAASQIGVAAKEVDSLLNALNQSAPKMTQLREQTAADAERVLERAFRLGLVLILVLLAGSVLAALVYRAVANKLARDRRGPSA